MKLFSPPFARWSRSLAASRETCSFTSEKSTSGSFISPVPSLRCSCIASTSWASPRTPPTTASVWRGQGGACRRWSTRCAWEGCTSRACAYSFRTSPLRTTATCWPKATGKSKRQIEELVATLFPKPPAPAAIRKLPERPAPVLAVPMLAAQPPPPPRVQHRPAVQRLTEDTYQIQFTATRAFRDQLQQAQDLLRHRVPNGDLAAIFEAALDSLVDAVKKERFALGRKARPAALTGSGSRHIPDPIRRAVYQRDGGRCTFTDDRGRRCVETGALEFDHLDGFARTHLHSVAGIRLLCRPHNQYAAEQMYGRAFMQGARSSKPKRMPAAEPGSTCPGTSSQPRLF